MKLLIADDERIIRESISKIIDWDKLDISLIGTAADGLEALNIIMDESPEIVMTDIRMPGLSGLDLIRQISVLNPDTQFIILSGYSEFDYAREAMKCGVRHYLLKPCDEKQIAEAVLSVKNIILKKKVLVRSSPSLFPLNQGALVHIITDAITSQEENYNEIIKQNSHYFSFSLIPYTLHYVYYLEHRFFSSALKQIRLFLEKYQRDFPCFYIYVENTLVIFYPTFLAETKEIHEYLRSLTFSHAVVSCVCKMQNFDSLNSLLNILLPKIIHYETIYIYLYGTVLPLSNRDSVIKKITVLIETLLKPSDDRISTLGQLNYLINNIHSLSLVQQIASIIFSKILSDRNVWIPPESDTFFSCIHKATDVQEASDLLSSQLKRIFAVRISSNREKDREMSRKIKDYIGEHLQDPDLSLKWISERVLFMSPDYVSKCFIKETGERFSQYLTRTRIEYAKKMLDAQQELNVQEVASKVGCGNNPLYFSQLFKKQTGISPSSYFKKQNTYSLYKV